MHNRRANGSRLRLIVCTWTRGGVSQFDHSHPLCLRHARTTLQYLILVP
jgi:hypothetical protein